MIKKELAKNEMGMLEVTISGQGNFIQLSAPQIQWPAGIEAFEPTVQDSLDKKSSPLNGRRTFRFAFVCSSPGVYNIPPVSLSFFKTDSGSYKTISAPAQMIVIRNEEKKATPVVQDLKTKKTRSKLCRVAGRRIVCIDRNGLRQYGFGKEGRQTLYKQRSSR
jgi:hypothetical protein